MVAAVGGVVATAAAAGQVDAEIDEVGGPAAEVAGESGVAEAEVVLQEAGE